MRRALAIAVAVLARTALASGPLDPPRSARCVTKNGGQECTWLDAEGTPHIMARVGPSAAARQKASKQEVEIAATKAKSKVHETSSWDLDIFQAADKYKVPQELVRAVIVVESNFDPRAVSRVGALGLMQLMPGTAAEMYVTDPYDGAQNIHGGTRYLRTLANMFDGDLVKTIAAYNAGPEAVRKAGGVPRIAETQAYVKSVVKLWRIYRGLDGRT